MTKKIYFLIIGGMSVIIVGLLSFIFIMTQQKNNAQIDVLNYAYGEKFSKINMYGNEGDIVNPDSIFDDYSIVFYLSEGCGTCINLLPQFTILENIYTEIDCKIIWFDSIPENLLNKYDIPQNKNYSLHGENRLDAQNPIIYLMDKNGIILHKDVNLSNIVEKIEMLDLLDDEEVIRNANKYLSQVVYPPQTDKVQMIYFSMVGCPDCIAANEIVNSKTIQDKFEVNYIYRNNTDEQDLFIDKYNIFSKAYGVKWYPSFLIIKNDGYTVIGETSIAELESVLIGLS